MTSGSLRLYLYHPFYSGTHFRFCYFTIFFYRFNWKCFKLYILEIMEHFLFAIVRLLGILRKISTDTYFLKTSYRSFFFISKYSFSYKDLHTFFFSTQVISRVTVTFKLPPLRQQRWLQLLLRQCLQMPPPVPQPLSPLALTKYETEIWGAFWTTTTTTTTTAIAAPPAGRACVFTEIIIM